VEFMSTFKAAYNDFKDGVVTKKHDSTLQKKFETCRKCEHGAMVMDYGLVNKYGRAVLQRLSETCGGAP
jgi:hypothetical protein